MLLAVTIAVLVAALALTGITHLDARHAAGTPAGPGADTAAPEAIRTGGPVVDLTDGIRSAAPPPYTIALTFDDGPDPRWTPAILDVLRRHDARATFFVLGSRAAQHPDLVRRIIAAGHEVGSHTFTHVDMAATEEWRTDLELSLTQSVLAGAAGIQTRLFRPPYSSGPDAVTGPQWQVLEHVGERGYLVVLADHDSRDWTRPGTEEIVASSLPADGQGGVVLFHDGGGDRAQTVAALDQLLGTLHDRGYRITTVTDSLELPAGQVSAGVTTRVRGAAVLAAIRASDALLDAIKVLLVVLGGLTVARLGLVLGLARRQVRSARRRRRGRRVHEPVSVIVPAYNESAGIVATVRSLADSTHDDLEIIVVDDGSTDGTADLVEALGLPAVRVLRQANAGKPAALNAGLAIARHDIVVMVDADTVFEPDTISQVIRPLSDPAVGAVSGNTKVGNRSGLLGRWQHLEYVVGFNLDRRMFEALGCIPTVPGAVGAFRREALTSVGGLSGDTLAEDTDLTMALIRRGWQVVYQESAVAWTEAPASLSQLWRQRYRWGYGTLQAMWKHRRALVERGGGGRLGRRGLPYLFLFHVLLPLLAPLIDVYALYGLVFLDARPVAAMWLGLLGIQALLASYALRLDRERLTPLWSLPLQQLVYRQLMYLVVIQSVATALSGTRLRWQRMHRTGQAARPPLLADNATSARPAGRTGSGASPVHDREGFQRYSPHDPSRS